MTQPRTVEECKKILFKLAIKHGVPPNLISDRLLSKDDKKDMLQGLLSLNELDFSIKIWKDYGMCNYANGSGEWYDDFNRYSNRVIEGLS